LAGAAEASEPVISERSNLSGSDAQVFAVNAALGQAGITAADLGPVDIYSCFPCAVFAATDSMGLPDRALGDYTLTGGLSFFGGPGNCYALHSLTAMVQALRHDGSKPAMVTANGGVMSKQAVGIYSAVQPAPTWSGEAVGGYQATALEMDHAPGGKARVLSFAQGMVKDAAGPATLLLEQENGRRALAVINDPPVIDLAGQIVSTTAGEKRHIATLV
jgi:acetyl-CoA C-acetyltransferase